MPMRQRFMPQKSRRWNSSSVMGGREILMDRNARSQLDAFALETLDAAYRSKVRPPTFSTDTPPDIHWTGTHRGGI